MAGSIAISDLTVLPTRWMDRAVGFAQCSGVYYSGDFRSNSSYSAEDVEAAADASLGTWGGSTRFDASGPSD